LNFHDHQDRHSDPMTFSTSPLPPRAVVSFWQFQRRTGVAPLTRLTVPCLFPFLLGPTFPGPLLCYRCPFSLFLQLHPGPFPPSLPPAYSFCSGLFLSEILIHHVIHYYIERPLFSLIPPFSSGFFFFFLFLPFLKSFSSREKFLDLRCHSLVPPRSPPPQMPFSFLGFFFLVAPSPPFSLALSVGSAEAPPRCLPSVVSLSGLNMLFVTSDRFLFSRRPLFFLGIPRSLSRWRFLQFTCSTEDSHFDSDWSPHLFFFSRDCFFVRFPPAGHVSLPSWY